MAGMKLHGQIQIDIGGKKRGFHFGMWVIMQIADRNNGMNIIEFIQLGKSNPLKYFGELLYLSGTLYNNVNGIEPDFNEYSVYDWIDMDSPELVKLIESFNDSLSFNGKTLSQIVKDQEGEKKSKTPVKKRKPKPETGKI